MLTTNDKIHLCIQFVVDSLAIAANITLLIIIVKRTPPTMRTFSIFLKNNVLIDLVIAVSGGLACSRVINVPDGSTVSLFIGPCMYVGTDFCLFSQSLQGVLHNLSSWLLLLSFLYRLLMLSVDHSLRAASCVIWTLCITSYIPSAAQINLYFSIAKLVPLEITETFNISGYAARRFPKVDNSSVAFAIIPTAVVSPCCMIIIYFVRQSLLRKLKDHKDRAQHSSVVKTLTYQTLLPMGSVLGSLYWSLDLIYQFNVEWPGRLLMMTASFICLASPIINLVCLPPYRKAISGWKTSVTAIHSVDQ